VHGNLREEKEKKNETTIEQTGSRVAGETVVVKRIGARDLGQP